MSHPGKGLAREIINWAFGEAAIFQNGHSHSPVVKSESGSLTQEQRDIIELGHEALDVEDEARRVQLAGADEDFPDVANIRRRTVNMPEGCSGFIRGAVRRSGIGKVGRRVLGKGARDRRDGLFRGRITGRELEWVWHQGHGLSPGDDRQLAGGDARFTKVRKVDA
jgi:hypothetical protein